MISRKISGRVVAGLSISAKSGLPVFAKNDAKTRNLSRFFVGLPTQTCLVGTLAIFASAAVSAQNLTSVQDFTNDYPTEARADYVFGCMEVNGGTSDALRRCSCSIDVIASILPYDKYVTAETVMSVVQVGGEKAALFHDPSMADKVADLRRAQAEGEVRCF